MPIKRKRKEREEKERGELYERFYKTDLTFCLRFGLDLSFE